MKIRRYLAKTEDGLTLCREEPDGVVRLRPMREIKKENYYFDSRKTVEWLIRACVVNEVDYRLSDFEITSCILEVNVRSLAQIAAEHPALIFQNEGYQYIHKKDQTPEDQKAWNEVELILKTKVRGFSKFNNFIIRKDGSMDVRIQYAWDESFTGVGYFDVKEIDTYTEGL